MARVTAHPFPVPLGYEEKVGVAISRLFRVGQLHSAPAELFHYTAPAALKSIVESGTLWATDVAYMNDASELTYAHSIFVEIVEDLLRRQEDPHALAFLERSRRALDPSASSRRYYVICFCEDGNLLSQWRAYASGGSGYSLGVDTAELSDDRCASYVTEGGQGRLFLDYSLCKVDYDAEIHCKFIYEVVTMVMNHLRASLYECRDAGRAQREIDEATGLLRSLLSEYYVRIKNNAFREENEWRLIFRTDTEGLTGPLSRLREDGSILVPYLNLHFEVTHGERSGLMPISSVVMGPTVNESLGAASIRLLLQPRYAYAKVGSSGIPLVSRAR